MNRHLSLRATPNTLLARIRLVPSKYTLTFVLNLYSTSVHLFSTCTPMHIYYIRAPKIFSFLFFFFLKNTHTPNQKHPCTRSRKTPLHLLHKTLAPLASVPCTGHAVPCVRASRQYARFPSRLAGILFPDNPLFCRSLFWTVRDCRVCIRQLYFPIGLAPQGSKHPAASDNVRFRCSVSGWFHVGFRCSALGARFHVEVFAVEDIADVRGECGATSMPPS